MDPAGSIRVHSQGLDPLQVFHRVYTIKSARTNLHPLVRIFLCNYCGVKTTINLHQLVLFACSFILQTRCGKPAADLTPVNVFPLYSLFFFNPVLALDQNVAS